MTCIRLLLVALGLSAFLPAHAQPPTVRVFADTTTVVIGDRMKLNFEMTAPSQDAVKFPVWSDTLQQFEIAVKGKLDTIDNKDNTITYRQSLELTRFDSGIYVLQPLPFLHKNLKSAAFDTVFSEALLLTVNTLPVDTTRSIRDIKPVLEVAFSFRDLLPYLLGAVVVAGLAVLLLFLLRRKPVPGQTALPRIPAVPPHVTALKALQQLAEEKLWQQGLYKQYHTRLTDIIRTYIEGRFQVLALEQTTDEILHSLQHTVPGEPREKLGQFLRLADLVKFAKVQPVASENETSLSAARDFVERTQPVEPMGSVKKEAVG